MFESIILLIISMAVILVAAEIFTNSVEWVGKLLGLGEGAVGSILAAVGTAMPETILPIIAILFVGTEASREIGIGAILGAPFMLSTAAFFVTGTAVFIFSALGMRSIYRTEMRVNTTILGRDMSCFLAVYTLAIISAFIPSHTIKLGVAVLLLVLYGRYVVMTLNDKTEGTEGEEELEGELKTLYFYPRHNPPPLWAAVLQLLAALALMVGGAKVFVANVEAIAYATGISPLVLALLIAPLATELPEKFNSVTWVRQTKDTLALGNITGAMVFQSSIPVAIGLTFTSWELDTPALISALIAMGSTAMVLSLMHQRQGLSAHILVVGGLFYLLYGYYVVSFL